MRPTEVTTEELQRRCTQLETLLLKRELAAMTAAQEARAKESAEAEAREVAARADALNADIEKTRQGAWVSHRLGEVIAAGKGQEPLNVAALNASIPARGWPPGQCEADHRYIAPASGAVAAEGNTRLHELARKRGFEL